MDRIRFLMMLRKIPHPGWLSLSLLLLMLSGASTADLEYQVKAEYLERFTRFVDWPEESFPSADTPFTLCVAGENPFGEYLNRMSADRKFQGRKVEVRFLREKEASSACHLLFVSSSETEKLDSILSEISAAPVLTIGDTPGFLEKGVLINLFLSDGFVRFEINPSAVRKSGLKFGSRLLKLGRVVP